MKDKIIESVNTVYNILGYGLTESIYQKALILELKQYFNQVESEKSVPIIYQDHEITMLRADIVIDNSIILELKATFKLSEKDEVQIKRYMQILNISEGILINFGKELSIKEIESN